MNLFDVYPLNDVTIVKAKGKMDAGEFVRKVQYHLANKNVDAAISECDKQAGSVGNVMRAGLVRYKDMVNNHSCFVYM